MDAWEKKLRREIEEEMDMYNQPASPYDAMMMPSMANNNAKNARVVLVATVILLSFITASAFFLKKNEVRQPIMSPYHGNNHPSYNQQYQPTTKTQPQYTIADRVVSLDNKVSQMQSDLRANDSQTLANRDRIWLMAIVNNENAYIRKYNTGEDYLTLGAGWKLSRMPNHVELDYESKQRLKKYL